jgi:hypothetical protein
VRGTRRNAKTGITEEHDVAKPLARICARVAEQVAVLPRWPLHRTNSVCDTMSISDFVKRLDKKNSREGCLQMRDESGMYCRR